MVDGKQQCDRKNIFANIGHPSPTNDPKAQPPLTTEPEARPSLTDEADEKQKKEIILSIR